MKEPTPGFQWRVGIAAYLTSQKIGNWSIQTDPDHRFFHVVFGTGTAIKIHEGKVVGRKVDLPGTDLQVRYDEWDSARLTTWDGGEVPRGWELRVGNDRSVTVGQVSAVGGTGPQWQVSAARTLESFTLPPTGSADHSAFSRLTHAGVLGQHTPHPQPGRAETTSMALDSHLPGVDLPGTDFPLLEMPGTVAQGDTGPSYIHTLTWSDT